MNNLKDYILEKFQITKDSVDPKRVEIRTNKQLHTEIHARANKALKNKSKHLDLTDLDVSKLDDLTNLLISDNKFETVDVTGWDVRNVKRAVAIFYDNNHLKQIIGLENWMLPKDCDLTDAFGACYRLYDIPQWVKDRVDPKNFSIIPF